MIHSVRQRVQAVNKKLDQLEQAYSAVDNDTRNTTQAVTNRVDNVVTSTTALDSTLQSLVTRVATAENDISSLALATAPEIAETSTALANIQSQLGTNQQNISALTTRVVTVEGRVDAAAPLTALNQTDQNIYLLNARMQAAENNILSRALQGDLLDTKTIALQAKNKADTMQNAQTQTDQNMYLLTARVQAAENNILNRALQGDLLDTKTIALQAKSKGDALQVSLDSHINTHNLDVAALMSVQTTVNAHDTSILNLQNSHNQLSQQLASGFASTLSNPNIYYAMTGLGPSNTQVTINYHWMCVMNTVHVKGRIIVAGPCETQTTPSNGVISFRLPVNIAGTFPSPSTGTFTYASNTVIRQCPRLLGHAWLDTRAVDANVEKMEVYGEPATNNVASIYLTNTTSFTNPVFWFDLMYSITTVNYSLTVNNGAGTLTAM